MFKKNTAVTGFPLALVSKTDGSAITTGTPSGFYLLDGGTQGSIAGAFTHEGNGQWSVNLTAGEMNGDIVGLLFTHTSAVPVHFTIKTVTKLVSELQDFASSVITNLLPAALVSGRIDASVGAMAANVLTATAINADAITDAKVASDVTIASVTGAVGSVTGAVGSVTGAVGSVTGNVGGNVTGSIGSLATQAKADVNAEADAALLDVGLTTTVTGRIDAAISSRNAIAPDNATITAINAKTAALPSDPADASDIAASFATVNTKLDTIDDFIDTEITTLITNVDALPTNAELATALGTADDATLAAIAALTIPSANTVADAVLTRGVSNVQDTADTTSLAALILATFESSVSGTTWTIRKTGGTTFVVKTLTVDADADPVIGVT